MTEKLTFVPSGLVKDTSDYKEIEFWGHDAGEYFIEEIEAIVEEIEKIEKAEGVITTE